MLQKSTKTFITYIQDSQVFGQISFFSGLPRSVTVKSRGFSEVMYLDKLDFINLLRTKYNNQYSVFKQVGKDIYTNPKDLK